MERHEAIQAAGAVFAAGLAEQDDMTPREQAEAAYVPGGLSVPDLEARIRARRGMPERDAA